MRLEKYKRARLMFVILPSSATHFLQWMSVHLLKDFLPPSLTRLQTLNSMIHCQVQAKKALSTCIIHYNHNESWERAYLLSHISAKLPQILMIPLLRAQWITRSELSDSSLCNFPVGPGLFSLLWKKSDRLVRHDVRISLKQWPVWILRIPWRNLTNYFECHFD